MLKNYQTEYKNMNKRGNRLKYSVDDLVKLEESLKTKDQEIKDLHEEIKGLNGARRKQEKLIEKKERNEDGNRLTKLVEEVRKQKEALQGLERKQGQKAEAVEKKQGVIKELEREYLEKCKKAGEDPVLYEDFKEKKRDKKK